MKKVTQYLLLIIIILTSILLGSTLLSVIGFEVENEEEKILGITSKTEGIYNGYMKYNEKNGTEYNTPYNQVDEITLSKEEIGENVEVLKNNTFINVERNEDEEEVIWDLGNNGNIIYKGIKVNLVNLKEILGEEGKLEILDEEQNLITTINKETEAEDDGSVAIEYEKEIENLFIRTSNIQKEGVLIIEHEKEIKANIEDIQKTKVKTTTNIKLNEEKSIITEDILEIQETTSNIDINLSNLEWTNEQQNEIDFKILLNANKPKDNLWVNPSIKIELPNEVEKVILKNQGIFHENGLELQEVQTTTNKAGNIEILINLIGEQTEYDLNELDLITSIELETTIILKKGIENKAGNLKVEYSNTHNMAQNEDTNRKDIELQIKTYQEEKEEQEEEEERVNYQVARSEETNIEGLKLEVAPIRGDINLVEGDFLYEGEFIKYNIKLTNTSEKEITGIKVIGNIPEGTIYGELEAEYFKTQGKYEYHFDETKQTEEIVIESLKPGESVTKFYEVRVQDIPEGQIEATIQSTLKAKIGETEVATYEITNTVKKAQERVFLRSFVDRLRDQWTYRIIMEKKEVETAELTIKVPKELELIYISKGKERTKY